MPNFTNKSFNTIAILLIVFKISLLLGLLYNLNLIAIMAKNNKINNINSYYKIIQKLIKSKNIHLLKANLLKNSIKRTIKLSKFTYNMII